jgi:hypothetical protein
MSSPSPFGPAPSLDAVRAGNGQLQRGQKGDAVARVQFLVGVFDDGGFGQRTQNAISAFQERNGIAVSDADKGKVGAETLAALETAYEPTRVSLAKIDERNKTVHLMLEFRKKLGQFAEALTARGMDALITDAFRTFKEQDILFAQGRTTKGNIVTNAKGGESNHNYGMAVDMYPVIDGKVFTDPKPANKKRFAEIQQAIIDEATRLGLISGVTFGKLGDKPHVQLLAEDAFNAKRKCLPIFTANGNSFDAVWDEARKML